MNGDMDAMPRNGRAWPFLVARGRHRGYRTLLAPGFLVAEREYGVLGDSVVPSAEEDQTHGVEVVTRSGRRLAVVHATHQVTADDIARTGHADPAQAIRDEHGRPLQLIYGFVCTDGWVSDPKQEDLLTCRKVALDVYSRFLGNEDGFTVQEGLEFPLRSTVTRLPRPSPQRPQPPRERPYTTARTLNLVIPLLVIALLILLVLLVLK